MRSQQVIVAIVQDGHGRFLVTYNAKWGGYAFPMIALPQDDDIRDALAIQAVEHDLGCKLPNATASKLDYMGLYGVSQRTGEDTLYEHWLYTVEPHQALDLPAAPTWNGQQPMFLTYAELTSRTDLTWTTPAITQEFVDNQEAVLAVVTRAGERETEFLVVDNANYGGYFFPTQRVKSEAKPERVAAGTVRSDLGYRGTVQATLLGEVTDIHFSTRFARDRQYRFHICEVQIPNIDLHRPGSYLEQALSRRGRSFLWLPGSRLNDRTITFSPTMPAVRAEVLHLVPARTFAGPLRQSEGGIALIQRTVNGQRQWLAQWNNNWKAFFFIGGHREGTETFRACVIREIEEELGLTAVECSVAASMAHRLEYRAISRSAGELTEYVMELYEAKPAAAGLEKIASDPMNKWLDEHEIRRMEANDGRPVSVSVGLVLELAGVL